MNGGRYTPPIRNICRGEAIRETPRLHLRLSFPIAPPCRPDRGQGNRDEGRHDEVDERRRDPQNIGTRFCRQLISVVFGQYFDDCLLKHALEVFHLRWSQGEVVGRSCAP
jgi:hypothetical protein